MNSKIAQDEFADEGLNRGLGRWQALAIVVGAVVGVGIYIRPASVAQLVTTPMAIMAVWLGAGFLSLLGALTYAELAARIPGSGGEYAFLRMTLGELPAFLFGWTRLIMGAGIIAAMAVALTIFLADVFPLREAWWRVSLSWFGKGITINLGPRQIIAVSVIAALSILNMRGVSNAGRFQSGVTSLKVVGLLSLVLIVALLGDAPQSLVNRQVVSEIVRPGALAYSGAMLAAMATYNGWAYVTMLGGEVRDAQRNVPWALVVGISAVILLYLGANLAYLHVLSIGDIVSANSTAHANASSVATRAALVALGPRVGLVLPVLFMVSALGSLHCGLLTVPRMCFAMARDGLLPASLAHVSKTTRTPILAIGVLAFMGAFLALLGSYDGLANMTTFGGLLFYALNAVGLLRLKRLSVTSEQSRRRVVPTWIPIAFAIGSLWLLVTSIMRGSVEIVAALILIGAGIPVFVLMRTRRTRSARVRTLSKAADAR